MHPFLRDTGTRHVVRIVHFQHVKRTQDSGINLNRMVIRVNRVPRFVNFKQCNSLATTRTSSINPRNLSTLTRIATSITRSSSSSNHTVREHRQPFVTPRNLVLVVVMTVRFLRRHRYLNRRIFQRHRTMNANHVNRNSTDLRSAKPTMFINANAIRLRPLRLQHFFRRIEDCVTGSSVYFFRHFSNLAPVAKAVTGVHLQDDYFRPLFLFYVSVRSGWSFRVGRSLLLFSYTTVSFAIFDKR